MKIHEYQAKEILRRYGVAVPNGGVAFTPEEAVDVAESLDTNRIVVKAQIHAGGRGKGGGIKLASSAGEVSKWAEEILGMTLVTHQTGPEGKEVKRILVEEAAEIDRELYVGIVLDRARSQYVLMVSSEGGVEIEKVAAETPEKIFKQYIDPVVGITSFQVRNLAFQLGLEGSSFKQSMKFMQGLFHSFESCDCSLAEINPLVVTKDGNVLALDAKINLDDSALYRHPDLMEFRDLDEEDPLEVKASEHHLNYIKLDGDVGCMVNGAGLAMATMDIIKLAGSMPANFLDVGGTASVETVRNGFQILMADPDVKAVLINIFGGIVRCDRVAKGVIEAVSQMDINVPIVIRLEGTNKDEAQKLLNESSLNFLVAVSFQDASEKIVAAIN